MDKNQLSVDRLYEETCASIRATDEISFKLMGFVPLISGATLLTFFLKKAIPPTMAPLVVALSLFAALITLGIFRWELRNIQTCNWLRRRAEELEEASAKNGTPEPPTAPHRIGKAERPMSPREIGKTEAEKWIYSVTILAWLFMPITLNVLYKTSCWLSQLYVAAAFIVGLLTALSAFEPVRVIQTATKKVDAAQPCASSDAPDPAPLSTP